MATNPTPAKFYSTPHRGNPFGVTGPLYGPHGHLGQDFNGWPGGTVIPSWVTGEVVKTGWSDSLGWFVMVLAVISNGPEQVLRYVSFCHMEEKGHDLGPIRFSDPVGPIGATGTLANGVHVHVPVARSNVLGGYDVEDPFPYIAYAIAGTSPAGDGGTPLDNDPQEYDMPLATILQFDGNRDGGAMFLITQLTIHGINGGDLDRAVAHYGVKPIGVPLGADGDGIVNAVMEDFDWGDDFDWHSLNKERVPVGATFRNPHYTIKP